MDMPASQESLQFNFHLGRLLYVILFRHITFLGKMTCFIQKDNHFHFPGEKIETESDFSLVQPRITSVDGA